MSKFVFRPGGGLRFPSLWPRSLRWRLRLWYGLLLLWPLIGLGAVARRSAPLFAVGFAVLALGLAVGERIISRAIRAMKQMGETAGRIAHGELSQRIEIAKPARELAELTDVLNATFRRLESDFARQQQLASDVAHELQTSLAILISEAELTLARERTAAEYRETVAGSLKTFQQMSRITEALLELARFKEGDPTASRASLDV